MALKAGAKKKHQILEATLEVIATDGVDAVTHRSVGLQAGVSHGVVSYHFSTRNSLIQEAFKFYFGSFKDMMVDAGWLQSEVMSPDHISDVITAVIKGELANPTTTLIEQELLLVASRTPALAEIYRDWEKKGLDIFAAGLKQTGYKQSQQLAKVVVNLIRGFLLERLTDPTLTEHNFKERVIILLNSASLENSE